MSAFEVIEPSELTILAGAVSAHCVKHRMDGDEDRERIAIKVMCLFRQGLVDPDRLSKELERVD